MTIGAGTAGQKTFNLRKPVTLIGSRRKCQLHLSASRVSRAHCVIVNTGVDVLVCDLVSETGTFLNNERIELAPLADGDIIQVGSIQIQVAITVPQNDNDSSNVDMQYEDPTAMPFPVSILRENGSEAWEIKRSVAVLGRKHGVDVHLDHADVSLAHAVLFSFRKHLAIFDLASRTGTWVDGEEQIGLSIGTGQQLRFGPFDLLVDTTVDALPPEDDPEPVAEPVAAVEEVLPPGAPASADGEQPDAPALTGVAPLASPGFFPGLSMEAGSPTAFLGNLETRISALHEDIARSWGQLTERQKEIESFDTNLKEREKRLHEAQNAIVAERLAIDAQTKDVEQKLAEIQQRTHEFESRSSRISSDLAGLQKQQAEFDSKRQSLQQMQADLEKRTAEVNALREELDSRAEQQKAQREQLTSLQKELADRQQQISDAEANYAKAKSTFDAERQEFESQSKSMREDLDKLQANKKSLSEERARVEARRREVEQQAAEFAELQKKIDADRTALDQHKKQFEQRQADLKQQESVLAKQRADIEQAARDSEAKQAAARQQLEELKNQEGGLSAKLEEIASADEQIKADRRAVEAERQKLEALSAETKSREAQMAQSRNELDQQRKELEKTKAEFEQHRAAFKEKETELVNREKSIANRTAELEEWGTELDEYSAELNERERVLTTFGSTLEEAQRAFQTVAPEDVAGIREEAEAAVAAVESAVAGGEPAADGTAPAPSKGKADKHDAKKQPDAKKAKEPEPEAPPRQLPSVDELDEETTEKLRVLRRLDPGRSDEDLVAQLLAEKECQGGKKDKKSWWRR